jgi:hypothetical protein
MAHAMARRTDVVQSCVDLIHQLYSLRNLKMKYSVLLAVLLALGLSACGKKEEAAAPAPEAAAPMAPAPDAAPAPMAPAPEAAPAPMAPAPDAAPAAPAK